MNKEVWVPVPGFDALYQVSSFGKIKRMARTFEKSNGRTTSIPEKILNPYKTSDGYLRTAFCVLGKSKMTFVHRAVAESFIKNPQQKRTVNHKNGEKTDNRVSNLEWASDLENIRHSWDQLGRTGSMLGRFGEKHHLSKPIYQYKDGVFIKKYAAIREAARETKVTRSQIYFCACGKIKTAGGFTWKREL